MFARINIYICTAAPFVLFLPRVMSSPAKVGLHAPLMYHTPCAAASDSYAVALLLTTPRDKTPTWGVGVFLVRRPNYGGAKHGKFGAARYGRSSRDDNFFPAPHHCQSGGMLAVIKLMFLWGRPETRLLHFTARHHPDDDGEKV